MHLYRAPSLGTPGACKVPESPGSFTSQPPKSHRKHHVADRITTSWPTSGTWGSAGPQKCRSSKQPSLCACLAGEDRGLTADGKQQKFLKYVNEVQPQSMELFLEQAPPQVVAAMRQTITNMLGTLPPQFFTVKVSTLGETLAQLMFSVMMTGYMFRNVQYRLDLRQSLVALPALSGGGPLPGPLSTSWSEEGYAPGVQKRDVSGVVLRWHKEHGAEVVQAVEYMEKLEAENAALRQQLTCRPASLVDNNDILEYVKSLESQSLAELTGGAEQGVTEAMHCFVGRLMGTRNSEHLKNTASDCTSGELAKLFFWLMVVGYTLRAMEVQMDIEQSLQLAPTSGPSPPQLPPGRT